jgi:tRNA-dihydrouridine synthase A
MSNALISPLAIAPMIDWTHTHFRFFMRLLAPQALLYTEMQTPHALFNNPQKNLYFDPAEHPIALQLGGSVIKELILCAVLAQKQGYDEINLNLGCPSDRVQAGRFGACLMAEATHVSDCIKALKDAVDIPVTAKTRIGIDNQDSYDFFSSFVFKLVEAGCDKLIVHARKAWLKGLNPKQNRIIPPIHYEYAYEIKKDLGELPVVINGNIETFSEINSHLHQVDGVMLGRLACNNPYAIADIHQALFKQSRALSRLEVLDLYLAYISRDRHKYTPLSIFLKPLLTFAYGLPNSKLWKAELLGIQQNKDWSKLHNLVTIMQRIQLNTAF